MKKKRADPAISKARQEALQALGEAQRLLTEALRVNEHVHFLLNQVGLNLIKSEAGIIQLGEAGERINAVLSKVRQQRNEGMYQIEALMHLCGMPVEPEYEYEPDLPGEFGSDDDDDDEDDD